MRWERQWDCALRPPMRPPSSADGGMENPCLTFVTPTLLAGDRSLTDTIIHEVRAQPCCYSRVYWGSRASLVSCVGAAIPHEAIRRNNSVLGHPCRRSRVYWGIHSVVPACIGASIPNGDPVSLNCVSPDCAQLVRQPRHQLTFPRVLGHPFCCSRVYWGIHSQW